jgi:hypothetical protein
LFSTPRQFNARAYGCERKPKGMSACSTAGRSRTSPQTEPLAADLTAAHGSALACEEIGRYRTKIAMAINRTSAMTTQSQNEAFARVVMIFMENYRLTSW